MWKGLPIDAVLWLTQMRSRWYDWSYHGLPIGAISLEPIQRHGALRAYASRSEGLRRFDARSLPRVWNTRHFARARTCRAYARGRKSHRRNSNPNGKRQALVSMGQVVEKKQDTNLFSDTAANLAFLRQMCVTPLCKSWIASRRGATFILGWARRSTKYGLTYTYDADGNVVTRFMPRYGVTWTYHWSSDNRLLKSGSEWGRTESFGYDALGQPVVMGGTSGQVQRA